MDNDSNMCRQYHSRGRRSIAWVVGAHCNNRVFEQHETKGRWKTVLAWTVLLRLEIVRHYMDRQIRETDCTYSEINIRE